jgi:hypothetical protein
MIKFLYHHYILAFQQATRAEMYTELKHASLTDFLRSLHSLVDKKTFILHLSIFKLYSYKMMLGHKRGEVTGQQRKLQNWELHDLYSSPDIIRQIKSRRMRWAGHVARMGEGRNVYRVLVGKPEGKRPLGRARRRWEDGIKWTLGRLVGVCGVDSPGSG